LNLARLTELAARAVPGDALRAQYRSVQAFADLHPIGYTVRLWWRLGDGHQILEYHHRMSNDAGRLPRLTAGSYAEQVEIHEALGLAVVGPGQEWAHGCEQLPLFEGLES